MKTSGVSSRGEFKTGGGLEFFDLNGEMSPLHAARTDAARTNKDIFRKSRREKSLFI
jgi:hypothetical protein